MVLPLFYQMKMRRIASALPAADLALILLAAVIFRQKMPR